MEEIVLELVILLEVEQVVVLLFTIKLALVA
jgi:hypothetical protein